MKQLTLIFLLLLFCGAASAVTHNVTIACGSGTGTGNVISTPGTINTTCTSGTPSGTSVVAFTDGTVVYLNESAVWDYPSGGGSIFAGWSGGSCSGLGFCKLTISVDVTITATFNTQGATGFSAVPLVDFASGADSQCTGGSNDGTVCTDNLACTGGGKCASKQLYMRKWDGLLYEGSNAMPSDHATDAATVAAAIVPLDTSGNTSGSPKRIVAVTVGPSLQTREMCGHSINGGDCWSYSVMGQSNCSWSTPGLCNVGSILNAAINHTTLSIIDGAQESQDDTPWVDPSTGNWGRVNTFLGSGGETSSQVQILLWLNTVNDRTFGLSFLTPTTVCAIVPNLIHPVAGVVAACLHEQDMSYIFRYAMVHYPKLKQVILDSRVYAGYAISPISPEPLAYEEGIGTKWLIEAQIEQMRACPTSPSSCSSGAAPSIALVGDLRYNNQTTCVQPAGQTPTVTGHVSGTPCAPFFMWGPYTWANGANARAHDGFGNLPSDNLLWLSSDFQANDKTHPISPPGITKVANVVVPYLLASPYTPWFQSSTSKNLALTFAGTGAGSVSSSPAGISCTANCSASFTTGTVVTLTATPTSSTFNGWSGDCSGSGTFAVTMSVARNCTATFTATSTSLLTIAGAGSSSSGVITDNLGFINCTITNGTPTGSCTHAYATGQSVILTAAANSGSQFTSFAGCDVSTSPCTAVMSSPFTVTATFAVSSTANLGISVASGVGSGTITSTPAGISCGMAAGSVTGGSVCNFDFTVGTSVTLNAVANSGSAFVGYTAGPCPAGLSTSCVIVMSAAKSTFAGFSIGNACPVDATTAGLNGTGWWCHTQAALAPHDNGWNRLLWSPDLGQFVLYANTTGSESPWENAFWSYPPQAATSATSVWNPVSQCGSLPATAPEQTRMCLDASITSGATTLTADFGGNVGAACAVNAAIGGPSIPQSGTLWIEDEAASYTSCDELNPSSVTGSCPAGSKQVRFNGLTRGQRTAAGYLSASSHAAAAEANLACPGPFLNGELDHPPSRHPVGGTVYDNSRGYIWETMGYEESWGYQDLWYRDVRGGTGWHRKPQFANYPSFLPNDQQVAVVHDPDDDVLIKYGGTQVDPRAWVMPLICPTTAYINGSGCVAFKWFPIANGSGRGVPVGDASPRATYDPVVHRMIVFGGRTSTPVDLHIAQQYDPTTGSWCLSDLTQGGTNSTIGWCASLPAVSGPTPAPQSGQNMFMPAWLYDSIRGLHSYYAGNGVVYQYAAATNVWTQVTIIGGPAIAATEQNAQSWAHDPTDDLYTWVQHNVAPNTGNVDVWQLPGAAISNPVIATAPPRQMRSVITKR